VISVYFTLGQIMSGCVTFGQIRPGYDML